MPSPENHTERRVYTVSELTENIKALLETKYPFLWISGEISNLRIPSSGHGYLTLKDDAAQISAVIFKGQRRRLGFDLQDGMEVSGLGRLTVYAPRGAYQIVLEFIEPAGLGALHAAFEQVKKRLGDEGLFDDARKRPLPFLPVRVAVVTSPSGAVLHDIVTVARRRSAGTAILVAAVPVQGDEAPVGIVRALEQVNTRNDVDVIILARGGGTFEDLQPFNDETVARAVYHSRIPVVSAVGHETDVTIVDFVADLRAPTPSAAAELVFPVKSELKQRTVSATAALEAALARRIRDLRRRLMDLQHRMSDPGRKVQALRLRVDDLSDRLSGSARRSLASRTQRLQWLVLRMEKGKPAPRIVRLRERSQADESRLHSAFAALCTQKRAKLSTLQATLTALNPTAILNRGYSITRLMPEGTVVRRAGSVPAGREVEISLSSGRLNARVIAVEDE